MPPSARENPCAGWRALMYVPAHVERFVAKAAQVQADAIILDLEDSVPETEKDVARAALKPAVSAIKASGADVLVRVNRPIDQAASDIEAAVSAGADAIVVAKVDGPSHVRLLAEYLERCEARSGGRLAPVWMMLLIETLEAFWSMREIATASDRIVAMALGGEDIAAAVHAASDEETLLWPRQQMIYAAASAGVAPFGLLGSIADFSDRERYRQIAERSRRFGFWGATCIHPTQVEIIKDAFTPSAEETAAAERIVAALEEAEARGQGAVSVDGKMVDPPVAERARRLIRLHKRISERR